MSEELKASVESIIEKYACYVGNTEVAMLRADLRSAIESTRTPGVAEIADDEGGYCPQTADEFIDWKNIELADDDVHDYIKEAWHLSAINADRLRSLAGEGE